jgi:hypothetical protein
MSIVTFVPESVEPDDGSESSICPPSFAADAVDFRTPPAEISPEDVKLPVLV